MTLPRDESPTVTSKSSVYISPQPVLILFGTRPEAIKLCPLISALKSYSAQLRPVVCVTAQHRSMLDQVLNVFGVQPNFDLNIMVEGQTLGGLSARLLSALESVFQSVKPSLTVVQGDTTTTLCGALASFYARVPVAHVEAGLRTWDLHAPFPEEMNRTLTTRLAALHFAPTESAVLNLCREGVPKECIYLTGNTGIDAVLQLSSALANGRVAASRFALDSTKKLVIVTAHRRESFGAGLRSICEAILQIAQRPDVEIVWPVHPNPNIRSSIEQSLAGHPNIRFTPPFSYVDFVALIQRATLILTDSGGIQEEAPSLGKPVLVLRDKTERPEAVVAGTVKLVGLDPGTIVRESNRLLDDPAERDRMARIHNPYGDGTASLQIARHIASFLTSHNVR